MTAPTAYSEILQKPQCLVRLPLSERTATRGVDLLQSARALCTINALARVSGLINGDRQSCARRCLVPRVTGEGGVVELFAS